MRTGRRRFRDDPAALAASQNLPEKYLLGILNDLRRANLVVSRRGSDGGYLLGRAASEIRLADIFRPLEGPLAEVQGLRPESATYEGAAENLQTVWVAVRASLRSVLEQTTVADIVSGRLPPLIRTLTAGRDPWLSNRLGTHASLGPGCPDRAVLGVDGGAGEWSTASPRTRISQPDDCSTQQDRAQDPAQSSSAEAHVLQAGGEDHEGNGRSDVSVRRPRGDERTGP